MGVKMIDVERLAATGDVASLDEISQVAQQPGL